MSVTAKQLIEMVTAFIKDRAPLLIVGMPGCGKTDITDSVTASLDHDLILEHPAVGDPTDFKGLP